MSGHTWIIDSGATSHICHDRSRFTDYVLLSKPEVVSLGDGHKQQAVGRGTVTLQIVVSGKVKKYILNNVLHVPKLKFNLISVSKVTSDSKQIVFSDEVCQIIDASGSIVAEGQQEGDLYVLRLKDMPQMLASVASVSHDMELWHRRYGHLGVQSINKLIKGDMVDGLNCKPTDIIPVCEPCVEGKH